MVMFFAQGPCLSHGDTTIYQIVLKRVCALLCQRKDVFCHQAVTTTIGKLGNKSRYPKDQIEQATFSKRH